MIVIGDTRESMRELIAAGQRVQMCVTSPPYFGLRDYGHPGQLGLEKTPEEYVANLVEVFRLVRDLLADDGTLWLNLGDSYAGYHGNKNATVPTSATNGWTNGTNENARTSTANRNGLKPKDLIGIPWRVAFALQADGWYLRQDIIWHKPNPMPESVTDRCTKAHEYLFLLSKSARYYFDQEAIKEPAVADHLPGNKSHKGAAAYASGDNHHRTKQGPVSYAARVSDTRKDLRTDTESRHRSSIPGGQSLQSDPNGKRNRRSVWTVATQPYSGAHFATFPPALIEPCILAGSKPGDTVFDPFFGSGTTGEVAQNLGRQWLGCELNPEYEALAWQRINKAAMGDLLKVRKR